MATTATPSPLRFELSYHPDLGYRVSVPGVVLGDERLSVREDCVTAADIEALAAAMWEMERHQWTGAPIWSALSDCEPFWTGCPEAMRLRSRRLLSAVLGAPAPGRGAA